MVNIDEKIERLLQWIKNTYDETFQPSTHSHISPKIVVKDFRDCGRGIHAKEPLNKKESIIRIPLSFLLNSTSVIRHITRFNHSVKLTEAYFLSIYVPHTVEDKFTQIYAKFTLEELVELSSFQLLSFYLSFEKQRLEHSFWKPFIDMLPEITDFNLIPLVWKILKVDHHEELLNLLPRATKRQANKVYERFIRDYEVVKYSLTRKLESNVKDGSSKVEEYLPIELFLWSWLCINSRCLYMELPQSKNSSDNFTMAPYVDLLNHSCDDQCGLKIDGQGFQVFTTTSYKRDEQLFLSYGPHPNDFLLCEYGFVIVTYNKWNDLDVSDFIIPLLKQKQIGYLKKIDYYGEYTISENSGISFRTEVALAVLQESLPEESRKLHALVNGYIDSSIYKSNSNILLTKILEKIIHDCDRKLNLEYNNDCDVLTKERKKTIGVLYRNMKDIAKKTLQDL